MTVLLPATPPGHEQRDDRDQQRHQHDVDDLDPGAQGLDFLVEFAPHLAKLLTNFQALLHESVDLGFLLGRQDAHVGIAAPLLQLGQAILGFTQFGFQSLLGFAQPRFGLAPEVLDQVEGAGGGRAAANADQVGVAKQVFQCIDGQRRRCRRTG